MATHSSYNLAREKERQERRARPSEVVSIDFEGDHHNKFYMPTLCWLEKYGPILNLNERRYYDLLAPHYNEVQRRSFPNREQIETYFSPDSAEERKSRLSIAMLGLIEWWSEPLGYRHSRRFFRMPHVAPDLRHYANRKQFSADELLKMKAEGKLPGDYEWLEKPGYRLLTPQVTQEQIDEEVGRRIDRWYSRRHNGQPKP